MYSILCIKNRWWAIKSTDLQTEIDECIKEYWSSQICKSSVTSLLMNEAHKRYYMTKTQRLIWDMKPLSGLKTLCCNKPQSFMTKYATQNCKADGWKVMIPISTVWCEGCHVQANSHVSKTFSVWCKSYNHVLLKAFFSNLEHIHIDFQMQF